MKLGQMKRNHRCFYVVCLAAWLPKFMAHGETIMTPVGTAAFQLVDTHLYAAPTSSFPSLFPHHFPMREEHAPPYDREFSDGLALAGILDSAAFSVSDFTAPNAVHFGYVLVPPSGTNGTSQDSGNGPIIPNAELPISIQGDVYLNGELFEQGAFGLSLPGSDGFDGRSHFIVENWENSDFAPQGLSSLVGDYEYRITMRDASNNGFDVVSKFTVVPEPAASIPVAIGAIAFVGSSLRRPRASSS